MSSPSPLLKRLAAIGLVAALPVLARGQSALSAQGGETYLSGALPGDQAWPGLALGADGGFVVYQDNTIDGAGWGIAARSLDADGNAAGNPFCVNAVAAGDQQKPRVALLGGGGAAFVWQGGRAGFEDVYARFLSGGGDFLTGDVLVSQPLYAATNSSTVNWQVIRNNRATFRRFRVTTLINHRRDFNANPVVTTLSDGNVVVAYASYVRYTTNSPASGPEIKYYGTVPRTNSIVLPVYRAVDNLQDVFVRLYTPGGLPLGAEVRANAYIRDNQRNPALAALDNGNFVVVWVSENQGLSPQDLAGSPVSPPLRRADVYARIFNAAGLALTDEFCVNDTASTDNASPSVAALAGGGFRVAWAQRDADPANNWDIFTRGFDANGTPGLPAMRVNSTTYGDQYAPQVASCPAGEMIVWTSLGQDGSQEGVFGQWLSGGALSGAEVPVNTTTAGRQYQQTVAAGPGNRVLVGWTGLGRGTGFDVFGQAYSASNP